MTLDPGTPVRVEMTKHGDLPHWRYEATVLGHDDHGTWLGVPAGTPHARPGLAFDSGVDKVVLVAPGVGSVSGLMAPGLWCDTYVDIATPPVWDVASGVPVLRSVDLDLDVIRRADGSVFVEDEDEFAEHQVALGYPDVLVEAARASCAQVLAAVEGRRAPYDGPTADRWLAALRAGGAGSPA